MRAREETTSISGLDAGGSGGLTPVSDKEFRMLSELIYAKSGITLGDHKRSLLTGRLNKELKLHGFDNYTDYYHYVVNDSTGQALNRLIESISTNLTFFWRENDHFKFFAEVALPEIAAMLRKEKKQDIRIWCAGCSTGEEPYTLAMLLCEYFGVDIHNWDVGVLATDISDRVLETAKKGMYSDENIEKLPSRLRNMYLGREGELSWTVRENVRNMVLFRKLNLMREEFPFRKRFHIIFCRNVMIYFDESVRTALVNRFFRCTEPGGYLFIGHSESLRREGCPYAYVRPAVYRKERE